MDHTIYTQSDHEDSFVSKRLSRDDVVADDSQELKHIGISPDISKILQEDSEEARSGVEPYKMYESNSSDIGGLRTRQVKAETSL